MTVPAKRADRRIQRTRRLLHDALMALIREKHYDGIAVTEILARADVGRSTFYTHFRDKDDLLVSGIHDMLRSVRSAPVPASAAPHERILWFSLPVFEHHDRHRRTSAARMGPKGRAILHEHLRRVIADVIASDVSRDARGRRQAADAPPGDLLVQYVASTFILVLNWWIETNSALPAKDVNQIFRALVLPTLASHGRTMAC